MTRKLLLLGLSLVLVLTCLMPVPVLAKNEKPAPPRSGSFSALANVAVVDPGTSVQTGPLQVTTTGEVIQGAIISVEGWNAVKGASLTVTHNSVINLSPPSPYGTGTYQGNARARVVVSTAKGGKLLGTYQATLSGSYSLLLDGTLIINDVTDIGTFKVAGYIHDDRGGLVYASGDWDAALVLTALPGGFTLAGQAELAGTYHHVGGFFDRDDRGRDGRGGGRD